MGAVSCVDASGHTRWTHRCAGRPNAAHIAGGRVLVTTDSLEYTPWGNLGPALLLDLSDAAEIAEPLPDQHPTRYVAHSWTLTLRPPRT